MNSNITGWGDEEEDVQKKSIAIFAYLQRLLSIEMKTKIVQHVPRINLSYFKFQNFKFSNFLNFKIFSGSQLLSDFQTFFFSILIFYWHSWPQVEISWPLPPFKMQNPSDSAHFVLKIRDLALFEVKIGFFYDPRSNLSLTFEFQLISSPIFHRLRFEEYIPLVRQQLQGDMSCCNSSHSDSCRLRCTLEWRN